MKTRVISGVVIGVVLALVLTLGGYLLAATLLAVSFISFFELSRATGIHKEGIKCNELEFCGYVSILVHYSQMILIGNHKYYVFSIMFAFFLIMVCYVLRFPKFSSMQAIATFFCFVYAPVNMSFVYLLRLRPFGNYFAWIPFVAWVCDTCAYFVGRSFGKHKLVPVLSPKKTIEGAIGGVAGSIIVGVIFGYLLYVNETHNVITIVVSILITLVGSIISQIGDLLASGIKRDNNIKDYGNCIPGHGGIMDRFDSVIFVIPCIYFLAVFFIPMLG
ncbi:phosphatidate cytidylyltransferase [Butyrivibrio sp. YAB3001]|uniref:phosphatidate cytidylyltransferase n=1 Tax=Butyrivibrio sp. YAB3001 TaxID=1520812 RepID=UPI0008F67266|nr:phosphatidate cytidylyltransferase [Butyrivibrio sp. YAB3001]SFC92956.1 phosphatidate cytidylyltransferase [Butyrivibrio sp. YAB3001]